MDYDRLRKFRDEAGYGAARLTVLPCQNLGCGPLLKATSMGLTCFLLSAFFFFTMEHLTGVFPF